MKQWFLEFWGRQGERVFWLGWAYIPSVQFIVLGAWLLKDPGLKEVGSGLIGTGLAGLTGIHAILLTRARGQDVNLTSNKKQDSVEREI